MEAVQRDPEKARAWRQRSKPLTRGAGPTVDRSRYDRDRQMRGSTLRQRSPELADYYRTVRAPLVAELIEREVELRGAEEACAAPLLFALADLTDPSGCYGPLTVHERLRRSQLGSLENPENTLVLCALHNTAAACCARGDAWHQAGIVVFEGDDGWQSLLAPRGERKRRAS